MINELEQYLQKEGAYKDVIKAVFNNPYAEKKVAFQDMNLSEQELDAIIEELEEKLIILSLTTQADSSLESRVPKRIFLINPELEGHMAGLL